MSTIETISLLKYAPPFDVLHETCERDASRDGSAQPARGAERQQISGQNPAAGRVARHQSEKGAERR